MNTNIQINKTILTWLELEHTPYSSRSANRTQTLDVKQLTNETLFNFFLLDAIWFLTAHDRKYIYYAEGLSNTIQVNYSVSK